jgi:hypothetical protein
MRSLEYFRLMKTFVVRCSLCACVCVCVFFFLRSFSHSVLTTRFYRLNKSLILEMNGESSVSNMMYTGKKSLSVLLLLNNV